MTKRICWKKGMRLTDEILYASDRCLSESLSQVLALASAKRFGLLPSNRYFNISLSFNKNIVEIEAIDCLAVTKDGSIIDIKFDTTYTNNIDSRIYIPETEEHSYILIIQTNGEWQETFNGFREPVYSFNIIPENSSLEPNMFPVARIINEFGWRIDELDFVPPCLFLSSHKEYIDKAIQFKNILNTTNYHLLESINSECKTVISIFWTIVEQLRITIDKDIDLMTPMALLGYIQKYVSSFYCGCSLDESLELAEPEVLYNYINSPYDYKDVYLKIKEGLELCLNINEKVSKFKDYQVKRTNIDAPFIANDQLTRNCTSNNISIPFVNPTPGATAFFSLDGTEPSKPIRGNNLAFKSDFIDKGREDDKLITIKIKAVLNGESSTINTYTVRLIKDVAAWGGITI